MKINRIDHIVLTVKDIDKTVEFYESVMGMAKEAMAHVKAYGVEIIEGPIKRTGARGGILSFYFRDPDGNLIQVAQYETVR
ncbi:MAG: VOC family protein [Candidatus Thiodiazotropha sp.]